MSFTIAMGAVAMLGAAQQTSQPSTNPISVAQWRVNVAPAKCQLIRSSGDPTSASVSLDTLVGSDAFRFVVSASRISVPSTTEMIPVSIELANSNAAYSRQATVTKVPDSTAIMVHGLEPAFIEAIASAPSITISTRKKPIATVALPAAAKAVAAFKSCIRDQMIEWGADSAQFEVGGAMPIARLDRDRWLSGSELMSIKFPAGELHSAFLVSVSSEGMIETCSKIDPTTADTVERSACAPVLKRKLFTPAKNPAGIPIHSVATFQIDLFRRPAGT